MNISSSPTFQGLVEFVPGFAPRPQISHVLFDFDGTISIIREGWPAVMVPMFVEMLPALPGESEEARRQLCFDDIMRLNGKQTIYQMIQLADRIKERGGTPRFSRAWRAAVAGMASASRCRALSRERDGRTVRETRGRSTGCDPLLWPAHLWRPR